MKNSESDREKEQVRLLKKSLDEIEQHNSPVYEAPNDTNDGKSTKRKQKPESNLR